MVQITFKPIVPKGFDGSAFEREITLAQRQQTKPALMGLFRKTVEGWDTPVEFEARQRVTREFISMYVFTDNQKYRLVSLGSEPHPIWQKIGGRKLHFQKGYRAATLPGRLTSRAKQRFGKFTRTNVVFHPGFKGREFDETIAEIHLPDFEKDMQAAANRAARKM